jgi:uncharacterized protein (TIGR02646 family)
MGAVRVKRVLKGVEPRSLQNYRQTHGQAKWDELRDENRQAYEDIRAQTHNDQRGLCAYCEIAIRADDPLTSRIEHFHPKSDIGSDTNWALEWNNMLAVCWGGSDRHGAAPYAMEPLKENLSCDAHKDRLIQQKKLDKACEGWVLDPQQIPILPSLFDISKSDGKLRASDPGCDAASPWPGNRHTSVKGLVEFTIYALNLNCARLCNARIAVISDIEHNIEKQRMAGIPAEQALDGLAERYLQKNWSSFFTTICLRLGPAADRYLERRMYRG